ncbi:hypothetical protein ANCDUO_02646 [Ancylostoma duodenale]|uniref:Peptidase M13 C-terminal domain-containing protein n=1 Tax=Ancylostoma duodenale TaxID=51022 RepID=A0A0C2GZX2_9BILA|nr:hypothetical protein ANCDUO_02646 [Ancylostoma duodenale]
MYHSSARTKAGIVSEKFRDVITEVQRYDDRLIKIMIVYGLIWCAHVRNDQMITLLVSDNHSPSRDRVNQVLANQPEFAAAFHCNVGTPMNPTERCAVW